jgi:hypothetical protein
MYQARPPTHCEKKQAVTTSVRQFALLKQDHLHAVRRNSISKAVCIYQAGPLTACRKGQAVTASTRESAFLKQYHLHAVSKNTQ